MPKSVAGYAVMSLLALVERENIFTLFKVAYNPECVSPEQVPDRIRAIVRAWGRTRQGRTARKETEDDFNWGDLANWLPMIHWTDGILSIETIFLSDQHIVAHDERLLVAASDEPTSSSSPATTPSETTKLIQAAQAAYSGTLLDNPDDYLAEIILGAIGSANGDDTVQTVAEIAAGMLESDAGELERVAKALRDYAEEDDDG